MADIALEKQLYLIAGRNALEGQSSEVQNLCECAYYLHRQLKFAKHGDNTEIDLGNIERIAGELLFKRPTA